MKEASCVCTGAGPSLRLISLLSSVSERGSEHLSLHCSFSSPVWAALIFAILFNLSISAWQVYSQEKTGQQWMTKLQEMVFQTYLLTLLGGRAEISRIAQQRLGQVLQTLNGDQQVSMVKFFSHNGLPATFIGAALQGSTSFIGADLQQIELPQIHLAQANLSRVNLREANLSGADLSKTGLYRA